MVLRWIESFLIGRFQYVRICFSVSSICSVVIGVPQGSVRTWPNTVHHLC